MNVSRSAALVLVAISLAACGPSFNGTFDGTDIQTVNCPGTDAAQFSEMDSVTLAQSGATVAVSGFCASLSGTVSGDAINTGTATCPAKTNSDGSTTIITFTTGTLTLSGTALLVSLNANAAVTSSDGSTTTQCTTTLAGTLAKQ